MAYFDFNSSRILTKRATKQLVTFVILAFLNSFIVSPILAAEEVVFADEPIPASAREHVIIKAPESKVKLNERLVAEKNIPDTRPDLAKKFIPLPPSERLQAGKLSKGQPLSFTGDPAPANGKRVTMTAYNSEKGQTDDDPCTAASGFNLCKHNVEDSVAANFLPMGTVIMAPELFGERKFVVRDRTHPKYGDRVDFWFKSREDALQFGKRKATIIVVQPEQQIATIKLNFTKPVAQDGV